MIFNSIYDINNKKKCFILVYSLSFILAFLQKQLAKTIEKHTVEALC